jgi:pyroglutamyl-peptidase
MNMRVVVFAAAALRALSHADASAQELAAPIEGTRDRPVILLTGFEPFGPGRPANPSWEGIKELDGRAWRGYTLAARQMKVEWGAPRAQLAAWIEELQPVAVFSFGQGGADGFAIETVAQRERGRIPDNLGQLPPESTIVADGPAELSATADVDAVLKAVSSAGFPVRASKEAGGYLCEECLYSLEYLKSQDATSAVMFCHVPPLGAKLGDATVDAAYVRSFVEAVLAAWDEGREAPSRSAAAVGVEVTAFAEPTPVATQAAADPREAAVRELIDGYFRSWSARDLERYGRCFMPQAAVQLVDSAGKLTTMSLRPFLESQREAHRSTPEGMTETPERVDVKFEGRLARVIVYWKLVARGRETFGYDHFTLMPMGDQWRIANLIFYETPSEAAGEGDKD